MCVLLKISYDKNSFFFPETRISAEEINGGPLTTRSRIHVYEHSHDYLDIKARAEFERNHICC